jgi:hypothetical protein
LKRGVRVTDRIDPSLAQKATRVCFSGGQVGEWFAATQQAHESEGRDSQDLEDVEIVVIGTASEADASLHAGTEGKALE